MHMNKKNIFSLSIISVIITAAIIIFIVSFYIKNKNVPTDVPTETLPTSPSTETRPLVSDSRLKNVHSSDATKQSFSKQTSNKQMKPKLVSKTPGISGLCSDTQALDNIINRSKQLPFAKLSDQEKQNAQKYMLRVLFKQKKTDQYDNYKFEYDPDFEKFISETIKQKDNDLKKFNDFKSFFVSAVKAYRTHSKQERYISNPVVGFTIPEIEKLKYTKENNFDLFILLLLFKTNIGYFNFVINQTEPDFITDFNKFMESITESTRETEKVLTKSQLDAFYREMSGDDNYVVLQYKFIGYYNVFINKSICKTFFEQIKNEFIFTPLLEQAGAGPEHTIIVFSKDTNSMEINLQNLLLVNIINKMEIGCELTFPVFLNAPPFLNFFLEPPVPKIFQKKISLFSLEDIEIEYNLTLFIIYVEKDAKTGNIFFKHKDEWEMFDDESNILSIGETECFKILGNGDFQTEKEVMLYYSKIY
ncbi:hypothetical protein CDIK_3041 [Cucumispora dikerogammari]|nr:hypothetical protein CDIK_3041 [Cucumispora dikerogammari]